MQQVCPYQSTRKQLEDGLKKEHKVKIESVFESTLSLESRKIVRNLRLGKTPNET